MPKAKEVVVTFVLKTCEDCRSMGSVFGYRVSTIRPRTSALCMHPASKRKNGNSPVLSNKLVIPTWCPLRHGAAY